MTNSRIKQIDLRTDTSTLPPKAMLRSMFSAKLGNDGLREDPTVNELERLSASMLGKEAALFVPSGTMGNLVSFLAYTEKGDGFLAEEKCHVVTHETGYRDVAGLRLHPLHSTLGTVSCDELRRTTANLRKKPKFLVIENSHNAWGGTVVSLTDSRSLFECSKTMGIPLHLDGARLFNATAFLKTDVKAISRFTDSIMFCLSKGLSAPVGSMVVGSDDFVSICREKRKLLGGGMRQAGVLAAAGIYALKHMRTRLDQDHRNASKLASGLSAVKGLSVDTKNVQTNIVLVYAKNPSLDLKTLVNKLGAMGVKVGLRGDGSIRCVTHRNVSTSDVEFAIEAFTRLLK